jgi:hypothetical protein
LGAPYSPNPAEIPAVAGEDRAFSAWSDLGVVEHATADEKDPKSLILMPLASTPRLHGAV